MEPYIYTTRAGVYIIDLEKTAEKLAEACDFISSVVSKGGKVLFVATKRQATTIVKKAAEETGMPHVTNRWIGGTLTNFENISKLARRLKDLRAKQEKGELSKYTKRERLNFSEEIEYLESLVGGIQDLNKLPEIVFIVDLKKEKTAIREARKKKVPIVGIVDTNCNPELVDYPIPSNDDATKALKFMINVITESIQEGKANQKPETPPEAEKPETEKKEPEQEVNKKDKE